MPIDSITLIVFSPTGTTRAVLTAIARGSGGDGVSVRDLTLPTSCPEAPVPVQEDLALIGAPVYGGRIPAVAAERLRRCRGDGTPAVPVVVYGNRAYEDALVELADLAVQGGFAPVAAAAFIGEHSYSCPGFPIAPGRPDPDDLRNAAAFGSAVRRKLSRCQGGVAVPGDRPYRDRFAMPPGSAQTEDDRCVRCGRCAEVCPTGAVAAADPVATAAERCIFCCACVKNCPTGARVMAQPRIRRMTEWLSVNCAGRREPEWFL